MQHSPVETRIEAPVERVWVLFSGSAHWEDWMPARFSESSGPVDEVGTTFVQALRRSLGAQHLGIC